MELLEETLGSIGPLDSAAEHAAAARLDSLTKPPGSLGYLEQAIRRYAAIRGDGSARVGRAAIAVYVADHGVADEGVSAFPQAVTVEMLRNLAGGGAAISVLARRLGYDLRVIDVGVKTDTSSAAIGGVTYRRIGAGTANFVRGLAMNREQVRCALEVGIEVARELARGRATLIGIGEMGIANSTAATAILSAITEIAPSALAGRGTGLDEAGVRRKVAIVEQALELHRGSLYTGESILGAVGGFEIAAMAGTCLAGASLRVPVIVDGFIATAAAAAAERIRPGLFEYLFFSHRSAEGGHALALEHMGVRPILDLDMRLGEGTGAALAMNVLEAGLDLFHSMATFSSAGVSGRVR
ncbi:MAG: nicotinate-nucleotide--dimethylbenzimidazole phosphoribosyltransferase [Deltaproteobacteria bacterium]|nr:nicotinate-nucleotide--dimethylbenzimidazole phosphoribosyltransferase [Deltaproteobacteria bacterium]